MFTDTFSVWCFFNMSIAISSSTTALAKSAPAAKPTWGSVPIENYNTMAEMADTTALTSTALVINIVRG